MHKDRSPISTCTLGKIYFEWFEPKLFFRDCDIHRIGATYEVACYTTQHIHNNCCRFQNFPFKCFEIVSLALHMLIPRLMMRKAQIYRIQKLNIFRFCHTAPLPHSGADFPFNILNILGVTPLHREFWNVYLNMSRAIEIYPPPLSISMDMRLFGSIQPHAICNVHFIFYFYFWHSQPYLLCG